MSKKEIIREDGREVHVSPAPVEDQSQSGQHGMMLLSQEVFSGPLPHPEVMRQYEEVVPGSAERILTMAEEQSRHRISMESKIIPGQQRESSRGQIFGFILCLLLITVGTYAIYCDHEWIGGIILTITVVSVASLFVSGRLSMRKNLNEKRD